MADSLQTINCPACGRPMRKVFVPTQGINIDICIDGCGGMFFDNREFKLFDEKNENIDELVKAIEGREFEQVDTSNPRSCPACGARMAKNYSSVKREIEIDECYACGGKFLDNGELQKFREEFENDADRTAATMRELYDTVGAKLNQIEAEAEMARKNQSPMLKLFNAMVYGKTKW